MNNHSPHSFGLVSARSHSVVVWLYGLFTLLGSASAHAQQATAWATAAGFLDGQLISQCTDIPPASLATPITAKINCAYDNGISLFGIASAVPSGKLSSYVESDAFGLILQPGQHISAAVNAYRNDWFLFDPSSVRPASMKVYAQVDGTMQGTNISTAGVLYEEQFSSFFDYSAGSWGDGWDGAVGIFLNPLSPIGCVTKFGATTYYPQGYPAVDSETCPQGSVFGDDTYNQTIPFGSAIGFSFPVTADKMFLSMTLGAAVGATNLSPNALAELTGQQVVDFSRTFQLTNVQFFDAAGNDITSQVRYTMGSGQTLDPGAPTLTPEPRTFVLVATGLLGLLARGYWRSGRTPRSRAGSLPLEIGQSRESLST